MRVYLLMDRRFGRNYVEGVFSTQKGAQKVRNKPHNKKMVIEERPLWVDRDDHILYKEKR